MSGKGRFRSAFFTLPLGAALLAGCIEQPGPELKSVRLTVHGKVTYSINHEAETPMPADTQLVMRAGFITYYTDKDYLADTAVKIGSDGDFTAASLPLESTKIKFEGISVTNFGVLDKERLANIVGVNLSVTLPQTADPCELKHEVTIGQNLLYATLAPAAVVVDDSDLENVVVDIDLGKVLFKNRDDMTCTGPSGPYADIPVPSAPSPRWISQLTAEECLSVKEADRFAECTEFARSFSQAFSIESSDDGFSVIRDLASGKCLAASAAPDGLSDGAITLLPCRNDPAMQVTLSALEGGGTQFKFRKYERCLGQDYSIEWWLKAGNLQVCSPTVKQQQLVVSEEFPRKTRLAGSVELQNKDSGFCLDSSKGQLTESACFPRAAQFFLPVAVAPDQLQLMDSLSGKCLTGPVAATANEDNIALGDCVPQAANQIFQTSVNSDGTLTYKLLSTGQCLSGNHSFPDSFRALTATHTALVACLGPPAQNQRYRSSAQFFTSPKLDYCPDGMDQQGCFTSGFNSNGSLYLGQFCGRCP